MSPKEPADCALAKRLEKIARRVTKKHCLSSWGFYHRDNPKCIEAYSIAHFETVRIWNGNQDYENKQIAFYARKRLKSSLAHRGLAYNKPVSAHKGVPLDDRTYTKQHAFEEPATAHQPPLEPVYDNELQRETVDWLTATTHSQDTIANVLGITNYQMKEIVKSLKRADTQVSRHEPTANPKELIKLQDCQHDGENNADPVVRMKDQICETLVDEVLVDLYRASAPIKSIAEQVGYRESWVAHRLGVLAHRYLCM